MEGDKVLSYTHEIKVDWISKNNTIIKIAKFSKIKKNITKTVTISMKKIFGYHVAMKFYYCKTHEMAKRMNH